MNRIAVILVLILTLATMALEGQNPRRRASGVNTAAAVTQSVNETRNDTSRINARRRAQSIHYHDENGNVVYLDTVTGTEWIDSTLITNIPKMKYPIFVGVTAGVDIMDGLMRIFGQKYGLAGATVSANLHNRYFPTVDVGLGLASDTPKTMNYTYKSPLGVYFRIGGDYNFLYNSNPDYKFMACLRYGFSSFSFRLTDITLDSPYWGQEASFDIPTQRPLYGWMELCVGLRVKIWGPLSAGWTVKYHQILHHSATPHGQPWYIPGYGTRTSTLALGFNFYWTFGRKIAEVPTPEK